MLLQGFFCPSGATVLIIVNRVGTQQKYHKPPSSIRPILNIRPSLLKWVSVQVFKENKIKSHLTEKTCKIVFRTWLWKQSNQSLETTDQLSLSSFPVPLHMFQLIFNLTARWVSPTNTNMKSPICHTLRLCSAHSSSRINRGHYHNASNLCPVSYSSEESDPRITFVEQWTTNISKN